MPKTENLKEAIDETKEHLKNEVNSKKEDLFKKGEDLLDEGKKIYTDTEGKVLSWKNEMGEKWIGEVSSYVKENPIKSVLMAIGGGFILGKLFKK